MAKKCCPTCGKKKPHSCFSIDNRSVKRKNDGLCNRCKSCEKKRHAAYNASKKGKLVRAKYAQTEKSKRDHRDFRFKRVYGITHKQYDKMLKEQEGVCSICSKVNENGRRLTVDHCHTTGEVRGLLCNNCNWMIGLADDEVSVLANAIMYLTK